MKRRAKPIAKKRGTVSWRELTKLLLEAGDLAPYATRAALERVITAHQQSALVGAELPR